MGTVNSGRVDYSSFGLHDKVAIVTGASQGIGRAIALGLAQAGAHVVLAKYPDKRQDEIKAVQAEIEALGRKAMIVQTDVAQVDQVRALMDQTQAAFGRIDILVNNAGIFPFGPTASHTEADFDGVYGVNVKVPFFLVAELDGLAGQLARWPCRTKRRRRSRPCRRRSGCARRPGRRGWCLARSR
jgi:NAD(P)-dependent dehydrogenase (short-subunit alcohol dehydrogenase family)